jgi:hypothetical protein
MKKKVKENGSLWKALLWLALGIAVGFVIGRVSTVQAKECKTENAECFVNDSKHPCCEGLECVPFREHGRIGKCEPVEPTPTPEPRWYVTIERPEPFVCGVNYVKWEGDYKPTKNTYVKFIINGRYPEVFYGDGHWWTGELTLAPNDYEIRAELWLRGCRDCKDKLLDSQDGKFTIDECEPEPTPTPTPIPTPTDEPKGGTSEAGAPQCTSPRPVLLPANPLVWRLNGTAVVQWQPTEGDRANIYYYEVQDPDNAHAVRDTENDGYVEINELGGLDWVFGIQQANDCAGGDIVWIVDGATNGWMLFTP